MTVRLLIAFLMMTTAGGALAAVKKLTPKAPEAAAVAASVDPVATASIARGTVYDRLIDPMTAAIRFELAEAGRNGSFLDKRDEAAVAEHYAEQGYAPSWIADGKLTERAKTVIRRLAEADADGLDVSAYQTPVLNLGEAGPMSTALLARADVKLSLAVVTYARHAYAGRLEPGKVSGNFGYEQHLPDSVGVLADVASAADPAAALAAYNPTHPQFLRLRDKLAALRKSEVAERLVEVPVGATLKPGMSDDRVPVLRQRMAIPAVAEGADVFDDALVVAVKAFQQSAGLKADGMVGKGTVAALNKVPVDPVPVILANMERWRWMPRDLGRFYVKVSIPSFRLDVMKDGKDIHTTRIVVGKVTNQTPIFSDQIEHIIVNPSWNVPASIAKKEMLPAAQANPASLSGYEVLANIGGKYRPVDPYTVDWYRVDIRKIQIRQPPGERNALGSIKFMFPNPYDVYLHDTPSKSLFQRDYRAFSHGCMRVMDPMAFADALLSEDGGRVSSATLKKMIGGPERMVKLSRKVPVHITYFTAEVDESGNLALHADLYGHDKRIEAAFGLASENPQN
ncbi:MAG: L,D-transpeptidase family protein [Bauldia sp.]